jgi:hypothetical protein
MKSLGEIDPKQYPKISSIFRPVACYFLEYSLSTRKRNRLLGVF